MRRIDPLLDLVQPYVASLGGSFAAAQAPDGTAVLSTPFRYATGDPVEIAVWDENGGLVLSDRGRLMHSLDGLGIEALRSAKRRAQMAHAVGRYGAILDQATVVMPIATGMQPGVAVQALVQSLLDAQAEAYTMYEPSHLLAECDAYPIVRQVLDDGGARYREDVHVTGAIGRTYSVDFRLAIKRDGIVWAILVVMRDKALSMAERWNFRFNDIHNARPKLQRLVVVDRGATWSRNAQKTIERACERVFGPGEEPLITDYLCSPTQGGA